MATHDSNPTESEERNMIPGGAPADLRDAAGKAPFEAVMGMPPGDGPNLRISPAEMRKSAGWLVRWVRWVGYLAQTHPIQGEQC